MTNVTRTAWNQLALNTKTNESVSCLSVSRTTHETPRSKNIDVMIKGRFNYGTQSSPFTSFNIYLEFDMIFLVFITVIIVYLLLSQILGDADSPIEYNTGIFFKGS